MGRCALVIEVNKTEEERSQGYNDIIGSAGTEKYMLGSS
jgi:hypothetical protein